MAPGLDELMIVNPGPAEADPLVLGEDGSLYRVQAPASGAGPQPATSFLLGDDGVLYQVHASNPRGTGAAAGLPTHSQPRMQGPERGRFFLGADGRLYELVK